MEAKEFGEQTYRIRAVNSEPLPHMHQKMENMAHASY